MECANILHLSILYWLCTASELMISIDEGQGGQSCLPDKYSLMCSQANSTLEDMKRRIYNGTISLEEIGVVYAKKHQIMKLCAASSEYAIEETVLELRNCECTAFKRHKTRVASFCREVERLQIEGITRIFC